MKITAVLYAGLLAVTFATPVARVSDPDTVQHGTSTIDARSATSVQETVALCSQYAHHSANGYDLENNLWGKDAATSGSQCTYYEGTSSYGSITWSSDWTWWGGDNNVKSYVYAGQQITKGNTIHKIKSMPTEFKWSYNTTNNVRANVAYDVFTAKDPNHSHTSGDYELMIWLANIGGVYPIGPTNSTVTIAGHDFNLHIGWNTGMKVYSFVRSGDKDINYFKADIKWFFDYLKEKHNFPAWEQHLIVNQVGTEAFTGGPAKFSVASYSAGIHV